MKLWRYFWWSAPHAEHVPPQMMLNETGWFCSNIYLLQHPFARTRVWASWRLLEELQWIHTRWMSIIDDCIDGYGSIIHSLTSGVFTDFFSFFNIHLTNMPRWTHLLYNMLFIIRLFTFLMLKYQDNSWHKVTWQVIWTPFAVVYLALLLSMTTECFHWKVLLSWHSISVAFLHFPRMSPDSRISQTFFLKISMHGCHIFLLHYTWLNLISDHSLHGFLLSCDIVLTCKIRKCALNINFALLAAANPSAGVLSGLPSEAHFAKQWLVFEIPVGCTDELQRLRL